MNIWGLAALIALLKESVAGQLDSTDTSVSAAPTTKHLRGTDVPAGLTQTPVGLQVAPNLEDQLRLESGGKGFLTQEEMKALDELESILPADTTGLHDAVTTKYENTLFTPVKHRVDRRRLDESKVAAAMQFGAVNVHSDLIGIDSDILKSIQDVNTTSIRLIGKKPWKVNKRSEKRFPGKGRKLRGTPDDETSLVSYELEQVNDDGVQIGHALVTVDPETKKTGAIMFQYPDGNVANQNILMIQPPKDDDSEAPHTIIELDKLAQDQLEAIDNPSDTVMGDPEAYNTTQAYSAHRGLAGTSMRKYTFKRIHVFSTQAVASLGGIANAKIRAVQQVAMINAIIDRSGSLGRYVQHELFDAYEVPYVGDLNRDDALEFASNLANVPRRGAHIVTITVTPNEIRACGRAWLYGWNAAVPLPTTKDQMLPVMTQSISTACDLSRYTVAHEDAHNYGCQHDEANAAATSYFPNAKGWVKDSIYGSLQSYVGARYPVLSYIGTAPKEYIKDPNFITGSAQANNAETYAQNAQIIGDLLGASYGAAITDPPSPQPVTKAPTKPTKAPTKKITKSPTTKSQPAQITKAPTPKSTKVPTPAKFVPTKKPTTKRPTVKPTTSKAPTSAYPTTKPTGKPIASKAPTSAYPTTKPTVKPTTSKAPTSAFPTKKPTTKVPTSYPTKKVTQSPTPLSSTPIVELNNKAEFEYKPTGSTLTVMLSDARKVVITTDPATKKNSVIIYNMNGRPKPTVVTAGVNYQVEDKVLQTLQSGGRYKLIIQNNDGNMQIYAATYTKKVSGKKVTWTLGKAAKLMTVDKPPAGPKDDIRVSFPVASDTEIVPLGIIKPKKTSGRLLEVDPTEFSWQEIVNQHLNYTSLGEALQSINQDKDLVAEITSSLDNINEFLTTAIQEYYVQNATISYSPSVDNLLINILSTDLGTKLLEDCDLDNIAALADPTNDDAVGSTMICFFYNKEAASAIFANSDDEQIEKLFKSIPGIQTYYYLQFASEEQIARIPRLAELEANKDQAQQQNEVRIRLVKWIESLGKDEVDLNKQLQEITTDPQVLSLIGLSKTNFEHFRTDFLDRVKDVTQVPKSLLSAIKGQASDEVKQDIEDVDDHKGLKR